MSPSSGRRERRWFSVVDITGLTLREENLKQKAARIERKTEIAKGKISCSNGKGRLP